MKYLDIRSQIKSGDVLAWSGGSRKSLSDIKLDIVRIFTRSEYSHVGIAWVIGERVFVVEAVIPLVRIYPLSKLTPFYLIKTPYSWSKEAEEKMLETVGKPYSQWEAIKAFLGLNTKDEKVWECAKLVNDTLATIDPKFEEIPDVPTNTVEYLLKNNSVISFVEA
jgi:hypothetical protein